MIKQKLPVYLVFLGPHASVNLGRLVVKLMSSSRHSTSDSFLTRVSAVRYCRAIRSSHSFIIGIAAGIAINIATGLIGVAVAPQIIALWVLLLAGIVCILKQHSLPGPLFR